MLIYVTQVYSKKRENVTKLDILFCQITMFIKVSVAFVFWTPGPLINRFYLNLSIKGSEAPKTKITQTLMNVVI